MTRRDQIHKWFVYALALVPVWLLDEFVLNRVPLFGVVPMLLPLTVVAVAVLEGSVAGAGFGMAVGLLWELAYPGGSGILVFGMTLAGMLTGSIGEDARCQSVDSCLPCAAGGLAMIDGARIVRYLFVQAETLDVLLQVAASEIAVSLCFTPFIYLLFRMVFRRVGGTKLA